MDKSVCDERHNQINYRLDVTEKRLNSHSERLDRIEQVNSKLEERLEGLIQQLSNLNITMRWFIGLLVGSFVAFFFYAVQQGVVK